MNLCKTATQLIDSSDIAITREQKPILALPTATGNFITLTWK